MTIKSFCAISLISFHKDPVNSRFKNCSVFFFHNHFHFFRQLLQKKIVESISIQFSEYMLVESSDEQFLLRTDCSQFPCLLFVSNEYEYWFVFFIDSVSFFVFDFFQHLWILDDKTIQRLLEHQQSSISYLCWLNIKVSECLEATSLMIRTSSNSLCLLSSFQVVLCWIA